MLVSTIRPNLNTQYMILPLVHNWREAYTTTHEYKTDIIESENGNEQRRAVRNEPRRAIRLMDSITGENRLKFLSYLRKHQSKATIIPDILYKMKMFEPPEPDSFAGSIVGAYPLWMKVGGDVILSEGYNMETRKITALPGNGVIIFAETSEHVWGGRTFIQPALFGRINDDLPIDQITNTVQEQIVTFEVTPGGAPETNFTNGEYVDWREIFMLKPDWASGVEVGYQAPREDVDYGFGVVAYFDRIPYPRRQMRGDYIASTHAKAQAVIDLFNRCQGRLKELLIPTWEDDIRFQFIFPGLAQIVVSGTDFADEFQDSTVYRRIMLRMKDGTYIHRAILDIVALPETNASVITLNEELDGDLTYNHDTVRGISWVLAARFATDKLEIEWLTSTACQYRLTFLTLENTES